MVLKDLALEPQPHPGAFPGAAAGPAGRAVAAPHSAAAALSKAPGIEAGTPAARLRGYGGKSRPALARDPRRAAERPRRMVLCSEVADDGENLEDHPALASRYVCRKGSVSACGSPGKFVSGRVEPFSFRSDKTLPGTLHHSGIKPAPPSDHTPLARRSAFCARGTAPSGNLAARAGLKRVDFRGAGARQMLFVST